MYKKRYIPYSLQPYTLLYPGTQTLGILSNNLFIITQLVFPLPGRRVEQIKKKEIKRFYSFLRLVIRSLDVHSAFYMKEWPSQFVIMINVCFFKIPMFLQDFRILPFDWYLTRSFYFRFCTYVYIDIVSIDHWLILSTTKKGIYKIYYVQRKATFQLIFVIWWGLCSSNSENLNSLYKW